MTGHLAVTGGRLGNQPMFPDTEFIPINKPFPPKPMRSAVVEAFITAPEAPPAITKNSSTQTETAIPGPGEVFRGVFRPLHLGK
ncbi:MAG: hypothetical protein JWN37_391 [Candidatus Nomurabacteria bacterium]|nr:hypothetical protein [Candidatus Nomurabacteria bacterium]